MELSYTNKDVCFLTPAYVGYSQSAVHSHLRSAKRMNTQARLPQSSPLLLVSETDQIYIKLLHYRGIFWLTDSSKGLSVFGNVCLWYSSNVFIYTFFLLLSPSRRYQGHWLGPHTDVHASSQHRGQAAVLHQVSPIHTNLVPSYHSFTLSFARIIALAKWSCH